MKICRFDGNLGSERNMPALIGLMGNSGSRGLRKLMPNPSLSTLVAPPRNGMAEEDPLS